MPIDRAKLPKVMMIKAAHCETAKELEKIAGGGSGSCFYVPPNKQCNHAYGT